jgi:general secretion pathway protein F
MPTFTYRALTTRGEVVTGELTAPDKAEVAKRIEFLGLLPIEMAQAGGAQGFLSFLTRDISWSDIFRSKPGADDVTAFSRDLATLLSSGVRIDQSLELLSDPEMSGALSPIVGKLRASVNAGETLADALARHPDLFPPVYISLVRIGEASGSLASVTSSMAQERFRTSAMRRKALDSLRYPAFIFCAAIAVLLFFLLFVLPKFAVVLEDLGTRMDPMVRFLLWLSRFVIDHERVLASSAIVLALAIVAATRTGSIRNRISHMVLSLPGLRGVSADYHTAIFCRSLGVLLGNGVRLTVALDLVAAAIADAASSVHWERTRDRVRHGARLGEALGENPEISPIAVRMLRIGEESGHLAPLALRAADLFEGRVERGIEKLVTFIGPAAILFIATIVGGLVVSLMTSLVSIGQLAN